MRKVVALVMAGGQGHRMRRSGVEVPKPLVPVAGTPLLEHNVRLLLHWGFRDVVVSTPAAEASVAAFVDEVLAPLASAAGGSVATLPEDRPLGNVGCAGLLAGEAEHALVVFADNLTVLDLRAVVSRHLARGAALTLACHRHRIDLPYGRLDLEEDRVVGYTEKPTVAVTVASAVSVLGPQALAMLPPDRPSGLVDLTRRLLGAGSPVLAFPHDADWVDVNDASRVEAAEALVARHPHLFRDRSR